MEWTSDAIFSLDSYHLACSKICTIMRTVGVHCMSFAIRITCDDDLFSKHLHSFHTARNQLVWFDSWNPSIRIRPVAFGIFFGITVVLWNEFFLLHIDQFFLSMQESFKCAKSLNSIIFRGFLWKIDFLVIRKTIVIYQFFLNLDLKMEFYLLSSYFQALWNEFVLLHTN